jgi:hypothetical protein
MKFIKERDTALIEYIKTGNKKPLMAYFEKYQIPYTSNEKIFDIAVYKAALQCDNIPEDIKNIAGIRLALMGYF